jgi:putative tricarboxylic transport membrane protein
MAATKKKELSIGVIMLGAGIVYLIMTSRLPGHSGIDATFVPYLLGGMMCLLGAIHLLTIFKAPQAVESAPAEGEEKAEPVSVRTVCLTLALMAGYVALLKPVGFPILTVVYLYLQFVVLTPVSQKVSHISYLLIALVTSAVVYFLFREAFDLMLPPGLLDL